MRKLGFIHITKTAGTSIEDIANAAGIKWGRFDPTYGPWHQLPSRKDQNIFKNKDWFMVVRNPYSRIISEFHCKWGGVGKDVNQYNITSFNQYIENAIKTRANHPRGDHYTRQHLYVNAVPGLNILKFENLAVEFKDLMLKYDINLSLNKKNNSSASHKRFTVTDLGRESITLINRIYAVDFKEFNYRML